MIELAKKTLLAGIGLAFMTKDKAEEIAKKIASEAKIAEGEGKKFVDELVKRSEDAKSNVEKLVNDTVTAALNKLEIPTRADVKKLEDRIKELEAQK